MVLSLSDEQQRLKECVTRSVRDARVAQDNCRVELRHTARQAGAAWLLMSLACLSWGDADVPYSPAVAADYPMQLLFGDTHSHTNNSPDAFGFGTRDQTPEMAYRYARGERMEAQNGMPVQIARPMDFLVVSDHAEYLGVFARLSGADKAVVQTELGGRWFGYLEAGDFQALMGEFVASLNSPEPERMPETVRQTIWADIVTANDRFNDPGVFTTFNAYEWTSMPGGNNLHRVVLFRDDAERAGQIVPLSAQDSDDPEDLWAFLESYENSTGGRAMSIAHNGNMSNGLMFAETTLDGEPLSAEYAAARMRWEPVYEVTQVKGDGEAHPQLSPQDPFADFETWDEDNLDRSVAKEPWMLKYEYARSALKLGLALEKQIGANPFKFGLVGGTDIHTGFADPDEANFFGKFADSNPAPSRSNSQMGGHLWPNWRLVSSGYAAVWAHDNTRESIFDAMQRRETYATTGPRIAVRFFAGWEFDDEDVWRSDFVAHGYAAGVPMGGELHLAPAGKAPHIMVIANRDPDGANLDRIQVVKGWQDSSGELQEKVYDVALASGAMERTDQGTVDLSNASYSNSIGEPQLAVVWKDPDFDPGLRAFYYLRVLQIPTPRWSAYDASYFGMEMAPGVPALTRERAYTSPVWYNPNEP